MIDVEFDQTRSDAMRTALVDKVRSEAVARRRRLSGTAASRIGALTIGVLAFGGGLTAASAAGWLGWPFADSDPLPGGDFVEVLPVDDSEYPESAEGSDNRIIDATGSGDEEFPLGAVPSAATHISVFVTCESEGRIAFGPDPTNNPSLLCDADDAPTSTWYDFPLAGVTSFFINSDADVRWSVAAAYLTKSTTDLGVNANGDTFGIMGAEDDPDLIAVSATNGRLGYVFADELAEADGTAAAEGFSSPEEALAWQEARGDEPVSVPVYLSDGETKIGEFLVGGW